MPQGFLTVIADQFVQVRTDTGLLLGCIPMVPTGTTRIVTAHGQGLTLGQVAMPAVLVEEHAGVSPFDIPGFIPAPGITPANIAERMGPLGPASKSDPDIGTGV